MSAIENQDRPLQSEADGGADPLLGEFQRMKKDIKDAEGEREKWRKYARECYDFKDGHQWSPEDEQILAEQHRPTVTFNRTRPLVKAVCGLEVNNRQSIVYLPRQIGQTGINEMITATGKWIRDECNAEDEESEAFLDLVTCGEGWTETRMDYDEDPLGKIVKERIDPLEMGTNKGASRSNYSDARMIYRIREMDPEDVRALLNLPDDLEDAVLDAKWLDNSATPADGGTAPKKDYPKQTRDGVTDQVGPRKTVKVIQCQYWRREAVHIVATSGDEQPQTMNNDDFEKFKARADQLNAAADADETGQSPRIDYTHAQSTQKVFYQCFIGMRILDTQPMKMGMFQFSCMTGERDRKKKWFTGMVGDMMDPQRWSNKFLAQTMNIMNSNAKGGIIAETDAFVNQKKATQDWADPTKIIWAKPGSLAKKKIMPRTPAPLPSGLDQLMMFAISSIRDVTGINLELLGQADREQAASLEQQRRQSAMTILATMFDNLRKYRKRDGRLMLHFIWLLPDYTLVRVVEQGQYQYIPLIKQGLDIEKFDIIIDQAPTSPDQKQYIWSITAQILQMNILPAPAVIELLKYSPYPESVVEEIRKALGLDGPTADQIQVKLQQAEQALQVLENELKQATERANSAENDNQIEKIKLAIDDYRAETERLNAQWQAKIRLATEVAKKATAQAGIANANASSEDGSVGDLNQVISGHEVLPDIQLDSDAIGGAPPMQNDLEGKIDQLAGMMQQLMQMMGSNQQQMEPVPPPENQPPAE
jgi:hypothetical protein